MPSAGNIYDNAVDDIVKGLEDAQLKVRTSAKYSMNNEMIAEGIGFFFFMILNLSIVVNFSVYLRSNYMYS